MKRWVPATLLPMAVMAVTVAPLQPAQAAVCKPALAGLFLPAASVTGGKSLSGTVKLSCRPSTAVKVGLAGFKGITVPTSVTVAKNKNSATFTVRTAATTVARGGKVTATLGKLHKQAALAVQPTPSPTCATPKLTDLVVPALLHVGEIPTATVKLSCAPKADTKLTVASSDARLVVPGSVVVKKGQRQTTFAPQPTGVNAGRYEATVTVGLGAQRIERAVTVNPGLKQVDIPPSSEWNSVDPIVYLTGPAPTGGLTVRLASDNPAVTVPETAYFQEGAWGGDVGPVTVRPVTRETTVTISVTLGTRTLKASKVLTPPFNDGGSMKIIPQDGEELHGLEYGRNYEVQLSAPAPEGGTAVAMKVVGDDAEAVRLENDTAHVSGGSMTASFYLSTADVTRTTRITLVATAGKVTVSLPLVIDPRVNGIVLPTEVKGGTNFEGVVSLAGPADTDQVVYLQQSQGGVDLPSSVTIPAGTTSATFTVTTNPTDEAWSVFFTASLGRQEFMSERVTINP